MNLRTSALIVGGLLGLLISCDKKPNTPTPIPSTPLPSATPIPQPTPVAGRLTALHADGTAFVNQAGQDVYLLGAVVCCEGYPENGWPWVSESYLQQIANAGGNYVHFRTGPFITSGEQMGFQGYRTVSSDVFDLNEWDEAMWGALRARIQFALDLGIYVEVDLIDVWVLDHELGPWSGSRNVNSINAGDMSVCLGPPQPVHERWIRKVVAETGRYPNVIYQDGNESWKAATPEWVLGMQDIVRDELLRRGYGHRPFGSNADLPGVDDSVDYVTKHTKRAVAPSGKPTMVNEYPYLTAPMIDREMRAAWEMGSSFHLWRGDMGHREWNEALANLRRFKDELARRSAVLSTPAGRE